MTIWQCGYGCAVVESSIKPNVDTHTHRENERDTHNNFRSGQIEYEIALANIECGNFRPNAQFLYMRLLHFDFITRMQTARREKEREREKSQEWRAIFHCSSDKSAETCWCKMFILNRCHCLSVPGKALVRLSRPPCIHFHGLCRWMYYSGSSVERSVQRFEHNRIIKIRYMINFYHYSWPNLIFHNNFLVANCSSLLLFFPAPVRCRLLLAHSCLSAQKLPYACQRAVEDAAAWCALCAPSMSIILFGYSHFRSFAFLIGCGLIQCSSFSFRTSLEHSSADADTGTHNDVHCIFHI